MHVKILEKSYVNICITFYGTYKNNMILQKVQPSKTAITVNLTIPYNKLNVQCFNPVDANIHQPITSNNI